MRLNKKQFKTWIKALRSGKYKQTRGILQDKNGFCCLGVACKVLIDPEKIVSRSEGNLMFGGVPEDQQKSPQWLKLISPHLGRKLAKANKDEYNEYYEDDSDDFEITRMNDEEMMTFDEIADILELVYIHKAVG